MVVEATWEREKNKKETRPINFDKDFWNRHWKQGENWPIADQSPSNDPGSCCIS